MAINIRLKTERQDVNGLMALRLVTRSCLSVPHNLLFARAVSANEYVVGDFFAKLRSIYGRLNLITKSMQVYNADETGVSVVHKMGNVLAHVGCRHVYSIASGEKGKTHTVLTCVSASGMVLPPMIVYPRKERVSDNVREGCVPNTLFVHSDTGWINADLFLEWFKFFINNIPPTSSTNSGWTFLSCFHRTG